MKFNILVILNDVPKRLILDDIVELRTYIKRRTPLTLNIDFKFTAYDSLTHKSFGNRVMRSGLKEVFGLDGLHKLLRPRVKRFAYHAVIFIYRNSNTDQNVVNWTHGQELHPGTELVEIAYTDKDNKEGHIFRLLTHELIHVFHKRCHRLGVGTVDSMDMYDHEDDPYHPNGNRARNLTELHPHWKTVAQLSRLAILYHRYKRKLRL